MFSLFLVFAEVTFAVGRFLLLRFLLFRGKSSFVYESSRMEEHFSRDVFAAAKSQRLIDIGCDSFLGGGWVVLELLGGGCNSVVGYVGWTVRFVVRW